MFSDEGLNPTGWLFVKIVIVHNHSLRKKKETWQLPGFSQVGHP